MMELFAERFQATLRGDVRSFGEGSVTSGLFAGDLDDLNELFCAGGNHFAFARAECCCIHEIRSYSEGCGPSLDEVSGGIQRDSAGRNQLDLRQRCPQRLNVAGAAKCVCREYLYEISACFPRGYYLGRCHSAGHHRYAVAAATGDRFEIQRRAHDELSAGKHAGARRFRVKHGAGSYDCVIAKSSSDLLDDPNRAWNGHGYLEDRDSSLSDGVNSSHSYVGGFCADHRNQTGPDDSGYDGGLVHSYSCALIRVRAFEVSLRLPRTRRKRWGLL